jgi:hypothetical protein
MLDCRVKPGNDTVECFALSMRHDGGRTTASSGNDSAP